MCQWVVVVPVPVQTKDEGEDVVAVVAEGKLVVVVVVMMRIKRRVQVPCSIFHCIAYCPNLFVIIPDDAATSIPNHFQGRKDIARCFMMFYVVS